MKSGLSLDRRHVHPAERLGDQLPHVDRYHVGRDVRRACFTVWHDRITDTLRCGPQCSRDCTHVNALRDYLEHTPSNG